MNFSFPRQNRLIFVLFVLSLLLVLILSYPFRTFSFPITQNPLLRNMNLYDRQLPSGDFIPVPLPYPEDALQSYISPETMSVHYDKHYLGYVTKLNDSLASYPHLRDKSLNYLLTHLSDLPQDLVGSVINNGGGKRNHDLYFDSMSPDGGGTPTGILLEAIEQTFGDFASFQQQFNRKGQSLFGSGWLWLAISPSARRCAIDPSHQNQLKILLTANQDNPLIDGLVPLFGIDLWEHAYYLDRQNQRTDYLEAWWNFADWNKIESRYLSAIGKNAPSFSSPRA